ncbi:MAG: IclR family transcriptional regulator [Comamonadaceae bacterium]|nr:MAG: IclR family transcriptional regulator [Comamonadaceae bacterium]
MRKAVEANGAQSAAKVLTLLRLVGAHNTQGPRLTDLIEQSGYDRSTTHRLLACLAEEGFVEHIPGTKRYRLGLESIQLGLMASDTSSVAELFQPVIRRVARKVGDTVFLMVRSGDHALCLRREEGSFPVKIFLVEPGMRRLLGLSTVGVSMLAALPDEDITSIHKRHSAEYGRQKVTIESLRELVAQCRAAGFAEQAFFMKEVYGVGCSVQISPTVHAGVSIAGINSRMTASRRREIGLMLKEELASMAWRPKSARMLPPTDEAPDIGP